jgi:hypothetical protein
MQATAGGGTPLAHLFYVHSPITYSIARATIAAQGIAQPVLIGGRGMHGAGIAAEVEDDGLWRIDRSLRLLRCMIDAAPSAAPLAVYLPHTAFLAGKLLKLSGRVARFHYLEEGYTSIYLPMVGAADRTTEVDLPRLIRRLGREGLLEALSLDPQTLLGLNRLPDIAFDHTHAKYGGSFACSPKAFAGMPAVRHLGLTTGLTPQPADLLILPGLINQFGGLDEVGCDTRLVHACRQVLSTIRALRNQLGKPREVVVKVHPRDQVGLPKSFLTDLHGLAGNYHDYCRCHALDANAEPALLNFRHYHVFGVTAVQLYVRQFVGADRLSHYPGFD